MCRDCNAWEGRSIVIDHPPIDSTASARIHKAGYCRRYGFKCADYEGCLLGDPKTR